MLEDGVPGAIVGDSGRLRQVVLNLLSNAVKFTEDGEVVLRLAAERIADASGLGTYEIAVEVRDTGIGIDAEGMQRLFESFSQADASITRRFGGTGLGLAISRRLAEAMGGAISAESDGPGEGATFKLTIVADAAPDLEQSLGADELPVELEGLRALIVDDHATNRRILAAQVARWGMIASEVGSPLEALELVRQGAEFDVALLDYLMPDLDGVSLAQAMREARPDGPIPVILHSSSGSLGRAGIPDGVEALITKPVKPSALHDALATVLAGHERRPGAGARPAAGSSMDAELASRLPLRILIAEDNLVNQKLALKLLERHGYAADVVSNGSRGNRGGRGRCLRRRPDGRADARDRRARGDAPHPRVAATRIETVDRGAHGERDGGRPGALPRRRHGRLREQADSRRGARRSADARRQAIGAAPEPADECRGRGSNPHVP